MNRDSAAYDAMRALSDALLSMLEQDARPPCADGSNAWTDEDHEVRATVAPVCDDCEISPRSRDFADTARPPIVFGIFGGHDFTTTTRCAPSLRQVTPSSGDVSNTASTNPKATP